MAEKETPMEQMFEKGTRVAVPTLNGVERGTVDSHTNPAMPDRSYLIHWDDDTYGWVQASKVRADAR